METFTFDTHIDNDLNRTGINQSSLSIEVPNGYQNIETISEVTVERAGIILFKGKLSTRVINQHSTTLTFTTQLAKHSDDNRPVIIKKTCNWELYGSQCGEPKTFTDKEIASISADNRTFEFTTFLPAPSDAFLWGGFGVEETLIIEKIDNKTVRLAKPITNYSVGDTVSMFRSCDKTLTTCTNVFNNQARFGGFNAL